MGRARIISQETYDPYRKWKIVGVTSAFIAAASLVYFTTGPDEAPVQAIQKTAGPYAGQNHQSAIADVPSNGSKALPFPQQSTQAPTNDMWGLLQRAENEAEQARHRAAIEYSKGLPEEDCQVFWVAHMNYQRMRESQNPIHKLQHFTSMPLRPAEFLVQYDYAPIPDNGYWDEEGRRVTDEWRGALALLLAPAMREMEEHLRRYPNDPDMQQDYAFARMTATHYHLNVPHQPLTRQEYQTISDQWRTPRLQHAIEVMSSTPLPADLTSIEAEKYMGYAYIARSINSDEQKEKREALGLTQQQADILAVIAHNIIDEQVRQHTLKMREHMGKHGAPCEYK